jgi:ABC-type transporter lipoprotein component MlaA
MEQEGEMSEGAERYSIVYENKDECWDEMELFIGDWPLEVYKERAERLKSDGHRNVCIVEYVTVRRKVMCL